MNCPAETIELSGEIDVRQSPLRLSSVLEHAADGAISGVLATIPMSVFMVLMHRLLPWYERYPLPPHQITMGLARSAGIASEMNDELRKVATVAAHFGYGGAMGGIYGIVAGERTQRNSSTGVAFGLAVWTGSYIGLLPALGVLRSATKHPARRNFLMIGAHVLWGAALGCTANWLVRRRTREID